MKLRLLLILPLNGGSLIVGRHLADDVQNMPGIELDVLSLQPLHDLYEKNSREIPDKAERLRKISEQLNRSALRRVAEFKPDLVLVMALAPVSPWFVEQAKHLGAVTAHWYIENFRYYPANPLVPKWQTIAPCYDYFFTIQKGAFFDALQSIGVSHFHYLPTGFNPRVHYPQKDPTALDPDFFADIVFIGSPYPNRIAVFEDLKEFDLALWGPGWSEIPALQSSARGNDQWIGSQDECKILNSTKIALNIHSSLAPGHLIERADFLNPRVFTIAACGAFQLVDDPELLSEVFEPGEELAVYHDLESLKDQLRHYLVDRDQRSQMAGKAHAHALAEHTYAKRMGKMLKVMNLN